LVNHLEPPTSVVVEAGAELLAAVVELVVVEQRTLLVLLTLAVVEERTRLVDLGLFT
jgi:hypothetical protein